VTHINVEPIYRYIYSS